MFVHLTEGKFVCFRHSQTQRGNHTCLGRRGAAEEKRGGKGTRGGDTLQNNAEV